MPKIQSIQAVLSNVLSISGQSAVSPQTFYNIETKEYKHGLLTQNSYFWLKKVKSDTTWVIQSGSLERYQEEEESQVLEK